MERSGDDHAIGGLRASREEAVGGSGDGTGAAEFTMRNDEGPDRVGIDRTFCGGSGFIEQTADQPGKGIGVPGVE
jgi:hypothetical protein